MMKKETTIFNKRFDELSSEEKIEHAELFENEAEFEQVKLTLLQLENMEQTEVLQPNPAMKDDLMAMFHDKWNKKAIPWYEKLGIFFLNPGRPIFFKPIFQVTVGLALIFLLVQIMPKMEDNALVADNTSTSNEVESMPTQKEMKSIGAIAPAEADAKIHYTPPQVNDIADADDEVAPSPVVISKADRFEAGPQMNARSAASTVAQQPIVASEESVSPDYASGFLHSDWLDKKEVKAKEKSNSPEINVTFNKDELQLLDLLEPAF
ncbi:MAG: hypothetical protein ABI207_05065 [Crocinitomicaceae bacterium]